MNGIKSIFLAAALWIGLGGAAPAQQATPRSPELKFVVIVSRHGVRPPLWTEEQLNRYSAEAWPKWDVPPGHLTSHGRKLMEIFGSYDRALFAQKGLFSPSGCDDAARVHFRADSDQRTLATGQALAAGMFPGCKPDIFSLPEGASDPIFNPVKAGVGHPDAALATAAVSGRAGGHPEALTEAYRAPLEIMQQVLWACKPGAKCGPDGQAGKVSLLDLPAKLVPGKGDRLPELAGPLATGSTLAQDFLLEYTNGMEGKDLGWGRVNESNLQQMMAVHTAYAGLMRRNPYTGRIWCSNLLSHVLKSMEQAVTGEAVPGALGKPGNRMLVIVGHDGNLSNISGTLDLSWLLPGDLLNDTPPGGALVFELWREPAGQYDVRTYYTAQTLEQMHKALPLTLDAPPARAPVFIPGCSTGGEDMPCGWKAFQHTVETAIDPAFVKP